MAHISLEFPHRFNRALLASSVELLRIRPSVGHSNESVPSAGPLFKALLHTALSFLEQVTPLDISARGDSSPVVFDNHGDRSPTAKAYSSPETLEPHFVAVTLHPAQHQESSKGISDIKIDQHHVVIG